MANTYNYLKNAWRKKENPSVNSKLLIFFPALVLVTIPLDFKYNSIAIGFFLLFSILNYKKANTGGNRYLLVPVIFFLFMALSLLWTIDVKVTASALIKELSLFLLPIGFYIYRPVDKNIVNGILKLFSRGVVIYGFYFLLNALYKYSISNDENVFYYHELAGDNAIYISALFSLPLFYYISLPDKKWQHYAAMFFVLTCILLLSSKTIIILDVLIIIGFYTVASQIPHRNKLFLAGIFIIIVMSAGYFGKIKDRIMAEYTTNVNPTKGYLDTDDAGKTEGVVYDVNMRDAWITEKFNHGDRFTGTSFRAYQIRIFTEMLAEDNILLGGYGLNASKEKIIAKGWEHNIFMGNEENIGYQKMNFHNQYIQVFAELGIFGLLILLLILGLNLKNAIKNKYFVHIAFAFLMITLFLTESFLWRQRGVVLFTTLYCLFNMVAIEERKKI